MNSINSDSSKKLGEVLIEVKGLKKDFGKLEVLKGVDLNVRRGEVVVIIGPSGSGKSTFLRSLNLLEKRTRPEGRMHGSSGRNPRPDRASRTARPICSPSRA